MKTQEYADIAKELAEHRLELATHERETYNTVLSIALKNRIELIRDYTVFGTALLATVVAIFSAQDKLHVDISLLFLAGFLSVITIGCCFISRMYYVQEGDDQALNIGQKFTYEISMSQALKFSESFQDYEERKSELKEPQQRSTDKWIFFEDDTKNIGILLAAVVMTLMFSLIA
jgi:hypothetical protein